MFKKFIIIFFIFNFGCGYALNNNTNYSDILYNLNDTIKLYNELCKYVYDEYKLGNINEYDYNKLKKIDSELRVAYDLINKKDNRYLDIGLFLILDSINIVKEYIKDDNIKLGMNILKIYFENQNERIRK